MVLEEIIPPKEMEPQGLNQALKDYLADAMAEQFRINNPLVSNAIEQKMAKLWTPRFEALEDRLYNEEKRASPHFSNSKTREENLDTTGPSHTTQRRHGKGPILSPEFDDPLDSFVGDGRQPPKGPSASTTRATAAPPTAAPSGPPTAPDAPTSATLRPPRRDGLRRSA